MTIVEAARGVTGGVDTHLDVHVAAALDPLGALLGTERFGTDPSGYKSLLAWLESFGAVTKVGVEGTGSYGAGLARFLRRADVEVIEVDRPNRAERRRSGKSDPLDAVEAARAALGGRATSISKSKDGAVEAIRVLVVAKRSARQARVKAIVQMRHLVITAPDQLRCRLKGLTVATLVAEAAAAAPVALGRSGDRGAQGIALLIGASDPRARERDHRARREDRKAGGANGTRAAVALRGRSRHGCRPLGQRRRQPRAAALTSGLGASMRGHAHPGFIWQELETSPRPGR